MATINNDFKVKHGLVVATTASILSHLESVSTTTGALTVAGGVGIGGNLNVNGGLVANGVNLLNYDPNILFVSENIGNDINHGGTSIQDSFKSIKHALSQANSGDTVYILAGVYYEEFPLTIPQGVSVRGSGLREVIVNPTTATNTQTAFLLNGETNISDFTVGGFFKPGVAFRFAPGAKITTKSPYIERFTVLTRGSVTSSTDPYGYNAGDAGGGAYIDAAVLDPTSLEPAMLWNEATFIVPNATAFYMTNGARAELLNGFTYFASKSIEAVSGSAGFGGVGKTKLRLSGITGTFTAGDTIIYKNSAGVTLASGTISSVDNDYVYISGPAWGFEAASDRSGKVVTPSGNAQQSVTQKKFGASSAIFDGVGDYLTIATTADFNFSTDDLTFEGWVYRSASGVDQKLFDFRTSSTEISQVLGIDTSNRLYLYVNGSIVVQGTTTVPLNTWAHVAVSRKTGVTRVFLDGTQEGSNYTDGNTYSAKPLNIGADYAGSNGFTGYIDEVRVTKGVGRYNGTFTVPAAAFGSDDGTVLLLHMNAGNGSTTFFDDASAAQNVYSTGASPATATRILLADYHQFGAELRCIGSAACFGDQGVIANGTGTDLKLIAFNLSFIGSGGDLSDDSSLVIQANEIIQQNGGKIYYQTVDQFGDFRVGDQFLVNQRTGNVSFGNATVDIASLESLTITDGIDSTVITPGNIVVDNVVISANTIATQGGNLTIDPAGTTTIIDSDLQINGVVSVIGSTQSTSTTTGALVINGGVGIGKNLNVGGSVQIASTSYIGTGTILTTKDLETVTTTATYITNDPTSQAGLATLAGTSTVYGTYNFGTVTDIRTFNDYNTGTNTGFYSINDATGAPGYIVYAGFAGVADFNRVVLNINYTQNSGHTVTVDLYNHQTLGWDSLTSYSGSVGWYQLALAIIDSAPYISSGVVTLRMYHSSSGTTSHRTWIDYIALENSIQGGQGPRGATGATGATGPQGLTTSTTSTFRFLNTTQSTSTLSGSVIVSGGVGVQGDVWAGTIYSNGQQVLTSGGSGGGYVSNIIGGTDISVSTSTGDVTISNTSTLQTVTGRGFTTTNRINITNATSSTTAATGALTVSGGVGVGENVYVGGQVGFSVNGTAKVYQYYNTLTNSLDTVFL